MFRERVNKVKVEITQKLRVVFENNKHNSDCSGVEWLHGRWSFLANDHVLFEECKALDNQIFDLEPTLVLSLFRHRRICLFSLICIHWYLLNKVRHKKSMWNKLKPCERKGRVSIGIEVVEQCSHIIEDLSLGFMVEAITEIDHSQNINQHSVVGLLVECLQLSVVVLFKFKFDKFKNLAHKLLLIKVKCLYQNHNKLDKAINKPIVQ